MTQPTSRSPAPARRRGLGAALALLALCLALPATGARAEDPKPPADTKVRDLGIPLPPPKEEKPPSPERLLAATAALPKDPLDWDAEYRKPPGSALSSAAQTTIAVARAENYQRTDLVKDIGNGGDACKAVKRNLDVGRHEILKHLYRKGLELANQRLIAEGKSPITEVQAVNAGGTGDYTRDQDVTVFAQDDLREEALFKAIADVAKAEPFKLTVNPKDTGGIDFPQIEVTLFPGGNDLPDSRSATDVEEFALRYRRNIEKQAADPEAYVGGGTDIEVKGRRLPGSMYVQQFTWSKEKGVQYLAELATGTREARSIFHGEPLERFHRWQRASHVFSDYIQAFRHYHHGNDHAPTKGPLKYAGRAIDQVCEMRGLRPWKDLHPDEKTELIRSMWPHLDPKTPAGRKSLDAIVGAVDTSAHTKAKKALPDGVDGPAAARQEQIALAFLRKSVSVTAGQMAVEMLDPPAFSRWMLSAVDQERWARMNAKERHQFAMERDETYRRCVGTEAMENLLISFTMLRQIDMDEGEPTKYRAGEHTIRQVLERAAPRTRPLLEWAAAYAEVELARSQSKNPMRRLAMAQNLERMRRELSRRVGRGSTTSPGQRILDEMEKAKPVAVLRAEAENRAPPVSSAYAEMRAAMAEHLKAAFPSSIEQWQEFRKTIAETGTKAYLAKRLYDEFAQWDTVSDVLTIVEMWQGGASTGDYLKFAATNILSRLHWGFGQLIAAAQVSDAESLKALGKNVFFATAARLVPWAGQAKLAFDIARGVVSVTAGYAVHGAVARIVDALYLGEAGRTDDSATGTVRGALRESGASLVPDGLAARVKDPDTGEESVVVDRPGLYRHWFGQWTRLDPEDVPRTGSVPEAVAAFVKAHDAVVDCMRKQAEEHEPLWVRGSALTHSSLLTSGEVEEALKAYRAALDPLCLAAAQGAMDSVARAGYKEYGDTKDRISEALRQRLAADVLAGTMESWQTTFAAIALLKKDVERSAAFADMRAVAEKLGELAAPSEQRLAPLSARAVKAAAGSAGKPVAAGAAQGGASKAPDGAGAAKPLPKIPPAAGAEAGPPEAPPGAPAAAAAPEDPPEFTLDVQVLGATWPDREEFDGDAPVVVSVVVHASGEASDVERPVKVVVEPLKKWSVASKAPPEGPGSAPDPAKVEPGDTAEDRILVRVMADGGTGPELARAERRVRVRMPRAAGSRQVEVFHHKEPRASGGLLWEYDYFRSFPGMPEEFKSDGGLVYHGEYLKYFDDGVTVAERIRYQYGVQDGDYEAYDSKGRLVLLNPYRKGAWHGVRKRFDPDSQARLEMVYEDGEFCRRVTTHGESGQKALEVTMERAEPDKGPRSPLRGTGRGWWAKGGPKWEGAWGPGWIEDLERPAGPFGERLLPKQGVWSWWHATGQLAERSALVDDAKEGLTEAWDAKGRLLWKATIRGGRLDGPCEFYGQPGGLPWEPPSMTSGLAPAGATVGFEADDPSWRRIEATYAVGECTGPFAVYHASGAVAERGSVVKGVLNGPYERLAENGAVLLRTGYLDGEYDGPYESGNEQYVTQRGAHDRGKPKGEWVQYYAQGKVFTRGSYRDGKREGRWDFYSETTGRLRSWEIWRAGEMVEEHRVKEDEQK